MKKYNIGDLIVLHGDMFSPIWKGVIVDFKFSKEWWGNGYYEVYWTPEFKQGKNISFTQLERWIQAKEAVVHTIK